MPTSSRGDWLSAATTPAAAGFDAVSGTWVLSHHADVMAAFREPDLFQVGSDGNIDKALKREKQRLRVRVELASVLTRSFLADRRGPMAELARSFVEQMPANTPVDLLRDFIQPWAMSLAVAVAGTAASEASRLADLQARLFGPESGRPAAQEELKEFFRVNGTLAAEPLFMGAADTLPRFLANAIVALLRHPAESARMRSQPDLMPAAIEELLRYAGPVHALHRRGVREVVCNGITISGDACAALHPSRGNRDPQVFADPNRLDVARRSAGHLSFGAGPHACPGAALVRMALAVVLETMAEHHADMHLAGLIQWRTGSSLFSPVTVPVVLHRHA